MVKLIFSMLEMKGEKLITMFAVFGSSSLWMQSSLAFIRPWYLQALAELFAPVLQEYPLSMLQEEEQPSPSIRLPSSQGKT